MRNSPVEAQSPGKLLNRTKNRTPGHMLHGMQHAQYVLLFLALAVNFARSQILQSYTLLLQTPFFMPIFKSKQFFLDEVIQDLSNLKYTQRFMLQEA